MQGILLPARHIFTVLILTALFNTGIPIQAVGEETEFRIGAHVALDNQWAAYTSRANRNFVSTLRTRTISGQIETLPSDRLYQLYRARQLDCILTGGWPHDDPQLTPKHVLVFEARLFTQGNTPLGAQKQILVGRMKQFPSAALPLENTMVDWLPLQNLQQGFDLLRAGRIDALLADPSHVHNAPNDAHTDIVAADLPAVRKFDVPLLCHDTVPNRQLIELLDRNLKTQ